MHTLVYLKEAQELCSSGNIDLLLFRIKEAHDIWEKVTSTFPMTPGFTEEDSFFLGLRYSEFLIDDGVAHTDYMLACAERQRLALLNTLGVDPNYLREQMIYMFNLY